MLSLTTLLFSTTLAATYYWDITYVQFNNRRVIGVNNQYPIPAMYVDFNDTLTVVVRNSLEVPTSLHSHGLFQNGSQWYDGAVGITNCPIPAGKGRFKRQVPISRTTFPLSK